MPKLWKLRYSALVALISVLRAFHLGLEALNSYQQDLAVADLNGDGRPDAINLHRTEGNIYIQFMTERHKFGRGPTLKLSTIRASELAFSLKMMVLEQLL